MRPDNIKIVYMGTPGFAVEPLQKIAEAGYNITAVVTAPDKPSGRGMKLVCSHVKEFAQSLGLNVLQPISLKDDVFVSTLKDLNPDIIVVVAFRMLPKSVWSLPRLGTFNLHASLLPKYRGAAPINWALINGEIETGVTTFLIDEEIDTGSIIFSEKCNILPNENFGSLHDRLKDIGAELVLKTIENLTSGKTHLTIQSSVEATMGDIPTAPKLNRENTKIRWNNNASDINNLIRGLSPYPAAHTLMRNNSTNEVTSVKIFESAAEPISGEMHPGQIVTDFKTYLKVECSTGLLSIRSIQFPGKKRLNIKDFLLGFRDIHNYTFIE